MRIVTIRPPWAQLIVNYGKDVENRVRNIAGGYRGPVAIHAGLRPIRAGDRAWWDQPAADAEIPARRGTNWIYYLRFGDRIKIGTSSSLKARLSTLPYDEVLALEPGSYDLERSRHDEFAPHLIDGQREWFRDAPELWAHVHGLRERFGAPADLMSAA